jgi:hypothetical protein
MIPHVEMPREVPLEHLALGLTLVCGRHDMKRDELRAMKEHFMKFDYDTLWPAAFETAQQNGRLLAVSYMTLFQLREQGSPDCMMVNMPDDKTACACICSGTVMRPDPQYTPDKFQKVAVIYPTNQTATVLA